MDNKNSDACLRHRCFCFIDILVVLDILEVLVVLDILVVLVVVRSSSGLRGLNANRTCEVLFRIGSLIKRRILGGSLMRKLEGY